MCPGDKYCKTNSQEAIHLIDMNAWYVLSVFSRQAV